MAENPGSRVLFLNDDRSLAISESGGRSVGNQVVLYGPDVARGPSAPTAEQDALLISETVAQTGPGTTAEVIIRDSQGESKGTITLTQRDMTIEDYCGYGSAGYASVSGPISDELLELGVTSFILYENTNTGDRSFGWFHDKYDQNGGQDGDITYSVSGVPSGSSMVVRDDDPGNDTYSFNPPDATAEHHWSEPNTDGLAIGKFTASELDGVTVTFNVTAYGGSNQPTKIRFIGDEGATVERAYDGTNTEVEITF
jgi:hypothetical protein